MATISVRQAHTRDIAEVREMAEILAEDLRNRHQLQARWLDNGTVDFHRLGIRGRLTFDESEVNIELHLNPMVSPFKDRIRKELESALRKRLR